MGTATDILVDEATESSCAHIEHDDFTHGLQGVGHIHLMQTFHSTADTVNKVKICHQLHEISMRKNHLGDEEIQFIQNFVENNDPRKVVARQVIEVIRPLEVLGKTYQGLRARFSREFTKAVTTGNYDSVLIIIGKFNNSKNSLIAKHSSEIPDIETTINQVITGLRNLVPDAHKGSSQGETKYPEYVQSVSSLTVDFVMPIRAAQTLEDLNYVMNDANRALQITEPTENHIKALESIQQQVRARQRKLLETNPIEQMTAGLNSIHVNFIIDVTSASTLDEIAKVNSHLGDIFDNRETLSPSEQKLVRDVRSRLTTRIHDINGTKSSSDKDSQNGTKNFVDLRNSILKILSNDES